MLARMLSDGFEFRVQGEKLYVTPADQLTDEQRDFIRKHKPALMDEVRVLEPVNRWLDSIGETDADIRAEVIECCKTNPKARAYFLSRAAELDLTNSDNVVPISKAMLMADCSKCRHQVRSVVNPEGGLSCCAIRQVDMKLPDCKRLCDRYEES